LARSPFGLDTKWGGLFLFAGEGMNRIVSKGSFKAKAADGTEFDILIFQEVIDTSDMQGRSEMPGPVTLKTRDGRYVNAIKKGHYQIVDVPVIPLTSNDPKAF
jgi:hypothetical protein